MKEQCDIVIATLPPLDLEPLHGPALLKSVVEREGYVCKVLDWNIELWHTIKGTEWEYLLNNNDLTFVENKKLELVWKNYLLSIAHGWVKTLEKINPRWFGICVFSQKNELILNKILLLARKMLPGLRIVIGGPMVIKCGKKLRAKGYVDSYVMFEGEKPIIGILKGDKDVPGVNENPPAWIKDLDSLPYPDYTDLDFKKYPITGYDFDQLKHEKRSLDRLVITGSRGCNNSCNFCDNYVFSPKYRFKKGERIAEEMIYLGNKYKMRNFFFTDALVNGNMKELRNMSEALLRYYEENKSNFRFLWYGQFTCQNKKLMTANDFELCRQAGLNMVCIGIESGSEKVRKKMNKNFTNEDMDFTLKQCAKNNIDLTLLLIVGYPGETEDDFQETIDMLTKYQYLQEKRIINVSLGPTLGIPKTSPLYKKINELGITFCDNNASWWIHKKTGNTPEVRIDRWHRLRDHCKNLGYSVFDNALARLDNELRGYKLYKENQCKHRD